MAGIAASGSALAQTESTGQVRARLETMSAEAKSLLDSKQQQFYRLSEAEQEHLRRLHVDLNSSPEGQQLRGVMERYVNWLKTLPSGQRAELLSLAPEDRLREIKRLLQEQEAVRMRGFVARELSDADLKAISSWMEDFVRRQEAEILDKQPLLKERLARERDSRKRWLLIYMAVRMGPSRDLLRPTPEDLERLKGQLSKEAQQELDKARQEGKLVELAERWMRATMFSRRFVPQVSPEELQRFYEQDLEPREREYLESLPAERMQGELTRMYHAHRFRTMMETELPGFPRPGGPWGGRGGPRSGSPGKPGGFGPPGGGPGDGPGPPGRRPGGGPGGSPGTEAVRGPDRSPGAGPARGPGGPPADDPGDARGTGDRPE
jgi:hypothetical protein